MTLALAVTTLSKCLSGHLSSRVRQAWAQGFYTRAWGQVYQFVKFILAGQSAITRGGIFIVLPLQ
jgi:hypothetical protein